MVLSPCKDCPDRARACHDVCDKYKEFRAELDKIKDAQAKDYKGTGTRYCAIDFNHKAKLGKSHLK